MPIVDPFDRHTTNTGIIDPFDAPKSTQLKIKDPFDTTQKPSFLKSAVKAPLAGVGDAIEMYSRALRTTDPEGGWDVIRNVATKGVDLGKSIAEKFPTENEDFGLVKRGVVGGIRSSIPSVAAGVPGAIAGMAGGVPGIVGGYAGSGAIITGAAEYDRFLELADQYGIPKEIARSGAIKSALVEGGIEGAANALDAILLKAGSPVVSGFKQFAKNALKIGGVESGTEAIQAALEAKIARDVGMPAPHPLEAAKEAVIPALTMGGIIGAGGTYANKILSKPEKIQQTGKQAIIDPFDNQIKPPQIQQTEKQEVVLPPGEKPFIQPPEGFVLDKPIQPLPKPENVEIVKSLEEQIVDEMNKTEISPFNPQETAQKIIKGELVPPTNKGMNVGKAKDILAKYDTRGYKNALDTPIFIADIKDKASYSPVEKVIFVRPDTVLSKEFEPTIVHELTHVLREKKGKLQPTGEIPTEEYLKMPQEISATKAEEYVKKQKKILDALDRMKKNIAQEDFGRSSIEKFEAMEEAKGFSPKEIANEFAKNTYLNLDNQTKKKFDTYISRVYGEPDSDFPTHLDVLKYIIPKNFESLEGTERGLYILMDEANKRGRNKNQIGMPQPKGFTPIEASPVVSKEPLKPDMIVNMYEGDKAFHENLTPGMRQLIEKYKIDTDRNKENWAEVIDLEKGRPEIIIGTKGLSENDIKTTLLHEVAHVKTYEEGEVHPEFWEEMSILQQQKAPDKQIEIAAAKARELEAWQWAIDNASRYGHKIERADLEKYKGSVRQLIPQLKFPSDVAGGQTVAGLSGKTSPVVSKEAWQMPVNDLVKTNKGYSVSKQTQELLDKTTQFLGIPSHTVIFVPRGDLGVSAPAGEYLYGADVIELPDDVYHTSLVGNLSHELAHYYDVEHPTKKFTLIAKIMKALSEGKPVPPEVLKDYPELQQTHTMPSGEVMPGAEHTAAVPSPAIQDELLQMAQTENIFKQVKGITSVIKIDKGFFDHFDRSEVRPIVQKSPGLFSTKQGMPLDEVADGLGISTDELASKLRDAVSKKKETELLKKQIQEYRPPTPQVTVAELGLKIGDTFKIHGEQYTVKERDAEGYLVIKNGDTYIVDEFDSIPQPDEGSLQTGKVKYSQPKMFEGEKTNIVPKMEAEIQGQQKLFQPKAGQLTPEQLQQQTSDINIGREGMPSIKSDAEIRYAPGTGINLETLDLPPDVKHTIYKLTQQYQPQFEDARNRKTWEEINKEAESLGFDANQLLERQKGEAYNAAKLKATKDIQNNTALEAKRIADETVNLALDAKLTAEQQAEILVIANMKMKKAAAILAQAGGAYSEAGRALNILRQVSGATKAQKNWEAILDALGGREMTLEMFKRIAGMDTTDTPQVAKFIREVQKARIPDMVSEAWRNAILSGTKTLITNPLSNAITFASNPIETGIAAVLEKGRSVITGKKPQVYFREVPAEIVGAIDGIWNGARVFLNTMKTEIPTFGETKIENAIMQTNIPGKLGRAIRVPQTILIAQDDAMKAVIYDSTMKTLATRLAISKGFKSKKEIVEFVGNLLTNPQGKNKRYFDLFDKRARADADYRTYNKALGKIGQILMRLRDQEFPKGSGIKPLYYVMPFMRTPTNIVKYGLERTPVNFARLGYKYYKGEIPSAHLSEEFAKPILGTIMFLWGWLMYEYGYMTGDAPKDVNDRAIWYNAGKKPYSFYLPWLNKYISYQRIEPLGSIFGMVADFFEITNRGIANTKDAFTKILLSLTRNWTNKTFIMGATNTINAYTDPERYGDRFVDGLTSSLVPNIISSFNSDPYYRQKQTFLDSIKAKVPVLSETLPPKRDILGSPAKRGEGRGMALFNQILPFGVVKPSDDPVRKELLRLNDSISFSVGMPNKYFRRGKEKIDISADVYDAYSKESGELAYKLVNRIVKSKGYGKMDDENKASLIRKQFDVARDSVRPKYIRQLKQNPQIGR